MLGNFSFGDYFKERAIPLAWEFVTEVLGIDPDRLWATVHHSDDEAIELWPHSTALPANGSRSWATTTSGRWATPVPADRPRRSSSTRARRSVRRADPRTAAEERYVEIWNLVFMQFDRQADGTPGRPAQEEHRHRHGPRAHPRGPPGGRHHLRHRRLHADDRDRRAALSGPLRRRRSPPISPSANWPTTVGP